LVADAGVVGIADDDGPRVGLAFVVVAPGGSVSDDDLLVHVRGRLPSYAIPATFRYLDELPRNSVGKLRRDELRRRA
jgi:fatty-acyl-CoA synthase